MSGDWPEHMPNLIRVRDSNAERQEPEAPFEMLKPSEYLSRYEERARQSSPSYMTVKTSDFSYENVISSTPIGSSDEEEDADKTEHVEEVCYSYRPLAGESFQSSVDEDSEQMETLEQLTGMNLNFSSDDSQGSQSEDYDAAEIKVKDETLNMSEVEEEVVDEDGPKAFIRSLAIDDGFFLRNYPDVIRDPEIKLDFQAVPQGKINIHISEVFSPVHFYFHYEYEVDSLMELIQEDYSAIKRDQLIISDENMKPGLLVACFLKYFDRWHRAVIIKPPDAREIVRLNIIDYGTVAMVPKKYLKFLLEKYSHYPRMSLRGRFVNLKPRNQERMWTENQVNTFLQKIGNKELVAEIVSHDEVDDVYELDVDGKDGKLRDWLIEHIADPFELDQSSIYPFCYYFPTFEMLENEYPSFPEKIELTAKGIDFDLLLETNFLAGTTTATLVRLPRILRMLGKDEFKVLRQLYFPKRRTT